MSQPTGGKSSFFSPRSGLAARLAKTPSFDELITRLAPELGVLKDGRIVCRRGRLPPMRESPDCCSEPLEEEDAAAAALLVSATGRESG